MSMIEKVSTAIAGVLKDCGIGNGEPWSRSDEMARAAIAAMREPLPDKNYEFEKLTPIYGGVWRAMIQAALDGR